MSRSIAPPIVVALTAIFFVALGVRVLWVASTDTQLPWLGDAQYYHATAQNIAEGRGYSVDFSSDGFVAGPKSEATAFWAPGYPLALAPLYKLFGSNIEVAKIFNAVVGALTVLPIFYLARRLRADNERDGRLGLVAAGVFALLPSLVYWTSSVLSEPLFMFAVASTLAVALWAGERRSMLGYVIVGLMLAATAFVRSQGALMIVPVAVLLLRDFDRATVLRAGAGLCAGTLVLIVPWAVRNDAAMGRPYLINDNLGYNLRLAHAPYSNGTSVPPQDIWDEQPGISFKQREILFDDLGRERALTYAREHPGREMQLAVYRIGYLLRSDSADAIWHSLAVRHANGLDRAYLLIGDVFYYAVISLTALSLFMVKPSRIWVALWSSVVAWLTLHLVFAGEPRYHVPLMPVAAILASGAAVGVLERMRSSLQLRAQ